MFRETFFPTRVNDETESLTQFPTSIYERRKESFNGAFSRVYLVYSVYSVYSGVPEYLPGYHLNNQGGYTGTLKYTWYTLLSRPLESFQRVWYSRRKESYLSPPNFGLDSCGKSLPHTPLQVTQWQRRANACHRLPTGAKDQMDQGNVLPGKRGARLAWMRVCLL